MGQMSQLNKSQAMSKKNNYGYKQNKITKLKTIKNTPNIIAKIPDMVAFFLLRKRMK